MMLGGTPLQKCPDSRKDTSYHAKAERSRGFEMTGHRLDWVAQAVVYLKSETKH
jgi:hypothetical protein